MNAKDVMRRQIVTVSPGTPLRELAEALANRHISGAPVVDAVGEVVGMVSQTDLVRAQAELPAAILSSGARVRDVMSSPVVTFEEGVPVRDLAREFVRRRIHRAVITRSGRACGIVSSMDLLRVLAGLPLDDFGRGEEVLESGRFGE